MEIYKSKVTIEDLPDEILVEIFLNLTPKGTKCAALVNKR